MKTFSQYRMMAAECEARRLRAAGLDVVVQLRPDRTSPSPHINGIPALFERSELERHRQQVAAAAVQGIRPEDVPSPVAVIDYAAWSYYPTCPTCLGRRIAVDGLGDMNGRDFAIVLAAAARPKASARCLRPPRHGAADEALAGRGVAPDCGWTGAVAGLSWLCFICGERRPGAQSGTCPACTSAAPAQPQSAPSGRALDPSPVGAAVAAPRHGSGRPLSKRERRRHQKGA